MSIDVIFLTQIASILVFLGSLFALYRLLVKQKDATIEALKEKNELLKIQIDISKESSPDVLADRLSKRVIMLKDEIIRLTNDLDKNKDIIIEKETDLKEAEEEIRQLYNNMEQARNILDSHNCPECGAPIVMRDSHEEYLEMDGRDISIEHEFIKFECGRELVDGHVSRECLNK